MYSDPTQVGSFLLEVIVGGVRQTSARLPDSCPNTPWRQLGIHLLFHQGSSGSSACLGTYHLQVWSTCHSESRGGMLRGLHFRWVSLLPHCYPQPHRKWFSQFFPSDTQQGAACTFSHVECGSCFRLGISQQVHRKPLED